MNTPEIEKYGRGINSSSRNGHRRNGKIITVNFVAGIEAMAISYLGELSAWLMIRQSLWWQCLETFLLC